MGTGPDLVLLAGGRIDGDFATRWGTSVKALVPLDGRTLLDRTLDAYDELRHLGRRVLVGPPELTAEASTRRVDQLLPDRGAALENVLAALVWLQEAGSRSEWTLLSATDLPFLTCEAVDEFLCRCPDTADVCLPIVERRPFEAAFPGSRHGFTRLRDGEWKLGGMLLVRTALVLQNQSRLQRLFSRRNGEMSLTGLLGIPFLFSVMTGRARVPRVEKHLADLLGCRVSAVVSRYPEIAFDVDHPEAFRDAAERAQRSDRPGAAPGVRQRGLA